MSDHGPAETPPVPPATPEQLAYAAGVRAGLIRAAAIVGDTDATGNACCDRSLDVAAWRIRDEAAVQWPPPPPTPTWSWQKSIAGWALYRRLDGATRLVGGIRERRTDSGLPWVYGRPGQERGFATTIEEARRGLLTDLDAPDLPFPSDTAQAPR